ncbi:hypothetical protein M885DRAFT_559593 [Pelagophyceae sp. CCMP2097]|nr:hypothetical protein M885DRAFT_559593 [Pelagophyceae sp. CCMP2097]
MRPWCLFVLRVAGTFRVTSAFGTLSGRLRALVDLAEQPWVLGDDSGELPRGLVADVGCDHGYIAAELAQRGRSVVACDVAAEPLQRAREHFAAISAPAPAAFLLGDGVRAVMAESNLPWCETAVIAGVGGRTAARLLDEAHTLECSADDAQRPPRRVVLQPTQQFLAHMVDLRMALQRHNYHVVGERWLDDQKGSGRVNFRRFLVTIVAEKAAEEAQLSDVELLIGRRVEDPARLAYVTHHARWLAKIVASAEASQEPSFLRGVQKEAKWRDLLQEELRCLETPR